MKVYLRGLVGYKGLWLDLEDYSDAEELTLSLRGELRILETDEEYEICDIEPVELYGQYINLSECYEMKESLEHITGNIGIEEDIVIESLSYIGMSTKDALESVAQGRTEISFVAELDINMEESIGYALLIESGNYDIPDYLSNYLDYEKYGRDCMIEGTYFKFENNIYEVR